MERFGYLVIAIIGFAIFLMLIGFTINLISGFRCRYGQYYLSYFKRLVRKDAAEIPGLLILLIVIAFLFLAGFFLNLEFKLFVILWIVLLFVLPLLSIPNPNSSIIIRLRFFVFVSLIVMSIALLESGEKVWFFLTENIFENGDSVLGNNSELTFWRYAAKYEKNMKDYGISFFTPIIYSFFIVLLNFLSISLDIYFQRKMLKD